MGVGAVLGDLLGAARGKTGLGPLTLAATGFHIRADRQSEQIRVLRSPI